jgi:hypothetical protein
MFKAHRISYMLATGTDPDSLLVCHRCDNPNCNSPNHLFIGTNSDNQLDCSAKGRKPDISGDRAPARLHPESVQRGEDHWTHRNRDLVKRGEDNPAAKLNPDIVREIRTRHSNGDISIGALARHYGVCHEAVRGIILRRRWSHVT